MLQSYNVREAVTVDLTAWSWMAQIELSLAQASEQDRAELTGLDSSNLPSEATPIFTEKKVIARKLASVSHRAHRSLSKKRNATTQSVATHDVIQNAAAAPLAAVVPAALIPAAVIVVPAIAVNGVATAEALVAFQQIHRQLHVQRLASLRGELPAAITQLTTHPQATPPASPVASVAKALRVRKPVQVKHHVPVSRPRKHLAPVQTVMEMPVRGAKSHSGKTLSEGVQTALVSPALLVAVQERTGEKRILSTESARLDSTMTGTDLSKFASYDAFREQTESTYRELSALTEKLFGTEEVVAYASKETTPLVQTSIPGVRVGGSNVAGYSAPVDYSKVNLNTIRTAMNTHAQVRADELISEQNNPTVDDYVHDPVMSASFVEAFEWKTPVKDVTTEVLTLEGWHTLRAADHWPTLYWNPDAQAQGPMISHNTAVFLAKRAGLEDRDIQADTGMVFGKIPAGWEVEFKGRAENVVYMNASNQLAPTPETIRYFAFVNAEPGARMVLLKAPMTSETASVAIPVINGSATYVDMTAVSKRVLSGTVLDAGSISRKGIAGASVNVVGQPTVVFSDASGNFRTTEVFAVGGYPLFVETNTPKDGATHRYRVLPSKMEGLSLFRMSEGQVQALLGQLEGGVSPDSSLVMAAIPKLVASSGDGRLFPSVHPILGNSTLTPETYTVANGGQLQIDQPLERSASTFLSVQVPEGLASAQVEDNNRNLISSQLIFAHPRIINVIGSN
jgi:hypothetical protein